MRSRAVWIGGTGSGKTHLCVAITANCIRRGARARFFNVVDLAGRLEGEARAGHTGRLAEQLTRVELVVLPRGAVGSPQPHGG
jgi:DNA replication protein DnaC